MSLHPSYPTLRVEPLRLLKKSIDNIDLVDVVVRQADKIKTSLILYVVIAENSKWFYRLWYLTQLHDIDKHDVGTRNTHITTISANITMLWFWPRQLKQYFQINIANTYKNLSQVSRLYGENSYVGQKLWTLWVVSFYLESLYIGELQKSVKRESLEKLSNVMKFKYVPRMFLIYRCLIWQLSNLSRVQKWDYNYSIMLPTLAFSDRYGWQRAKCYIFHLYIVWGQIESQWSALDGVCAK